jgi:shikimate dehydrogenase
VKVRYSNYWLELFWEMLRIWRAIERSIGSVKLLNRSVGRARELVEEASAWGAVRMEAGPLDGSGKGLVWAQRLVNTTSLRMPGQAGLDFDLSILREDAVACDVVYTSLLSGFRKVAHARGLRICTGLGMLLNQAAPGFEHWFGIRPEVSAERRALVEADIERGAA